MAQIREIKKRITAVRTIRRITKIRKLVRHLDRGYRWLRSVDQQRPFGPDGGPIPWLDYGAFRFLDSFDRAGARVGECGSGWSSMWWLSRGASVESIEEIRIDLDPAQRDAMMARTGRRTVPQIYLGDTHVGGCDDLVALDQRGGLLPLLQG